MHLRLITVLSCAMLASACRQSGKTLQRQQQQYDVVQEGSSGIVTSSVGEAATTMSPSSTVPNDTAIDTTTNFTLGGQTPPGAPSSGSIAGTLPSTSSPGSRPRQNRIRVTRKSTGTEAGTTSSTEQAGISSREATPPASDTSATSAPVDEVPRPSTNDRPRDRSNEPLPTAPQPSSPPTDTTGTLDQRSRS